MSASTTTSAALDPSRGAPDRDHDERGEQPHGQGRVPHEAQLGIQEQPEGLADPHRVRARRLVGGEVRRAELGQEEERRGEREQDREHGGRDSSPRPPRRRTGEVWPKGFEQREQGQGWVLDGREGGAQRGRAARRRALPPPGRAWPSRTKTPPDAARAGTRAPGTTGAGRPPRGGSTSPRAPGGARPRARPPARWRWSAGPPSARPRPRRGEPCGPAA